MYIIDLLVGVPKTLSIHEYKYKYKSVQVAQVQAQDTTYKIQDQQTLRFIPLVLPFFDKF